MNHPEKETAFEPSDDLLTRIVKFFAEFLRRALVWLWHHKWMALLLLIALWLLAAILVPGTIWFVRETWAENVVKPLGINKYLATAIALLFAVPMGLFMVLLVSPGELRFWRQSEGKKVTHAFVWSKRKVAIFGIFALLILASLFQYAIAKDRCVRANELGEEETYDGPCEESKRVAPAKRETKVAGKPTTDSRTAAALRKQYRSFLLPTGEFKPWFLRKRANLDRIPWVNQNTGQAMIFSCSDPGGTQLYIQEGYCRTGEPRRPADRTVIELMYREAAAAEQRAREVVERERKAEDERRAREEADQRRMAEQTAAEEQRLTEQRAKEEAERRAREETERQRVAAELTAAEQRAREEAARQATCPPAQPAPAAAATITTPAVQMPPAEQAPAAVAAATPAPAATTTTATTATPVSNAAPATQTTQPTPPLAARLAIVDEEYNGHALFPFSDSHYFDFTLREMAGVDVVFAHETVSIWRREERDEPLSSVKQRPAIVFERGPFALHVPGNGTLVAQTSLAQYEDWLQWYGGEWVEVELQGTDARGNPVEITLSGAD